MSAFPPVQTLPTPTMKARKSEGDPPPVSPDSSMDERDVIMSNIMSNVRNSRPQYLIKRQPSYSVVLEEPDEIEISLFQQTNNNSNPKPSRSESSTRHDAGKTSSRSNIKKQKEKKRIEKHESSGDDSTVVGTDQAILDMEARLVATQKQLEEAKAAHSTLTLKHERLHEEAKQNTMKAEQELAEHIKKSNLAVIELQKKLESTNNIVAVLSTSLSEESAKRKEAEVKLKSLQSTLERTELVLNATKETEVRLTSEAKSLLSTLQMSIYDGDLLHSLQKKGYEANVAKKVATKGFVAASSALLKESLSMLEQLSSAVEEHNTNIIKTTGEVGDNFQTSASTVSSLLNNIKEQIKLMADTMESQVSGEGGMNTVVSEASSKIRDHLAVATSTIDKGETELASSCSELRTRLLQESEQLALLKNSLEELKQTNASSLEASFTEMKIKLNEVMQKTEEAITDAETVRRSAHAEQVELISRWKQEFIESCTAISTKAEDHSDTLEKAIKKFVEGMEDHIAAEKALKELISYLSESGKSHVSKVSKQESLILANVILLDKSFKKQCELRKSSLQTIMSKVQDIVQTEINALSTLAEEQFTAFKTNAFELKKANTSIAVSAKDILTRFAETNSYVLEKVEALKENDACMLEVAQQTNKCIQNMGEHSKLHRDSVDAYALLTQDGLEKIADLDVTAMKKMQTIVQSNQKCASYLDDSLQPGSIAALSSMLDSGKSISGFAFESILEPTLESLDSILKPREEILQQAICKHEEISSLLDSQKMELSRISQDHKCVSSEISNKVSSLASEYETKAAVENSEKIQLLERQLLHCVSAFSDDQSKLLSVVSDKTKEVGTKMMKFVTSDLKMKEEIPTIPERKCYSYSQQLTKTPSEEVILRQVTSSIHTPLAAAT